MVKFTHTIFYVKNMKLSLEFFNKAFDFETKFVYGDYQYAELVTGETTIAFTSEELANSNLPKGYIKGDLNNLPFACEISLTTDDIEGYIEKAVKAGGVKVTGLQEKPWGNLAYVRDPNGILIELSSHCD